MFFLKKTSLSKILTKKFPAYLLRTTAVMSEDKIKTYPTHSAPTIENYMQNPHIRFGSGILLVKDINHSFVASNDVFSNFSGIAPEKLQGLTDLDMPWSEQSELYMNHERAILSGESYSVIEPLNGRTRSIIHTSKEIIYDKQGRPAGTLAMALLVNNPVEFESIASISQIKRVSTYGDYKLSLTEVKVLYFLLHGLKRGSIADKLNISSTSVDTYMRRIRIKFAVSSNVTLIEKCIFNGFHEIFPFQIVTK